MSHLADTVSSSELALSTMSAHEVASFLESFESLKLEKEMKSESEVFQYLLMDFCSEKCASPQAPSVTCEESADAEVKCKIDKLKDAWNSAHINILPTIYDWLKGSAQDVFLLNKHNTSALYNSDCEGCRGVSQCFIQAKSFLLTLCELCSECQETLNPYANMQVAVENIGKAMNCLNNAQNAAHPSWIDVTPAWDIQDLPKEDDLLLPSTVMGSLNRNKVPAVVEAAITGSLPSLGYNTLRQQVEAGQEAFGRAQLASVTGLCKMARLAPELVSAHYAAMRNLREHGKTFARQMTVQLQTAKQESQLLGSKSKISNVELSEIQGLLQPWTPQAAADIKQQSDAFWSSWFEANKANGEYDPMADF